LYFVRFNIDIGFSLKSYMVITFFGFVLLHKHLKFTNLFLFEKLMLFFILISSMSALNFRYPGAHLRFIFVYFVILFFYFVVRGLILNVETEKIESCIEKSGYIAVWFSIIYFVMGAIALGFVFRGNNIDIYGLVIDRNIPRLTGTVHDPNIFVFFITPYFYYVATHLNSKKNIVGFVVALLCIVLTFSRGGHLGVLAGVIVLLLFSKKRLKQLKIGVIFLVSILVLYSFKDFLPIDPFEFISSRFLSANLDGGSGRKRLWANAINTFKDNPIFGIGINATRDYSIEFYSRGGYVHNTFLEVLSEMGIVGFTVYVSFWASILYYSIKITRTRKNLFILCTFVSMFFQIQFLSILYNEMFYFMILILYRYYYEYINVKLKEKYENKLAINMRR
ncbi:O-antigen ligase family protein, partial [Isachenkonia alkalipeptolytica]